MEIGKLNQRIAVLENHVQKNEHRSNQRNTAY